MVQKRIHIYFINKIKASLKTVEKAKNAESVNLHTVRMYEGCVKRWLKKADIIDDELANEVINACKQEDSVSLLKRSGWSVLEGYAL